MARHVDVVVGTYHDGLDEQVSGKVAKKVYDIVNGVTTIHSVSITRRGKVLVAMVVWDD